MNIAEKVLQLKQDFDEVYAAGKAAGGGSGVEFDRYLKTAQFTSLNMFGTSEVVLNFDNMSGFINLFSIDKAENTNTTVEHLTINSPNEITSLQSMLYCNSASYDYVLKRVTLNFETQNCTNFQHAFTGQRALEIVDGTPLNMSAVMSAIRTAAFTTTPALKEVRFEKESIPLNISFAQSDNLSTETIQSIIDGLATVDTAQTLTLHASIKILQSQVDSANAKGWTIAGGTVVSEEEYYG